MTSGLFGVTLEGIVRQSHGAMQGQALANSWKAATMMVVFVGLLPLMIILLMVRMAFRVAMLLVFRSAAPTESRSLFGELFSQGILSRLGQPAEARSIYTYVVESSGRLLNVRQEGDFVDGRIYPGNTVKLRGVWRGGTLVLRSGENVTLATRLTLPGNGWRSGFFVAVVVIGLLYAGLHAAANAR